MSIRKKQKFGVLTIILLKVFFPVSSILLTVLNYAFTTRALLENNRKDNIVTNWGLGREIKLVMEIFPSKVTDIKRGERG